MLCVAEDSQWHRYITSSGVQCPGREPTEPTMRTQSMLRVLRTRDGKMKAKYWLSSRTQAKRVLEPTWHSAAAIRMKRLSNLCIQQPINELRATPVIACGRSRMPTWTGLNLCASCMKKVIQNKDEKNAMERQSVERSVYFLSQSYIHPVPVPEVSTPREGQRTHQHQTATLRNTAWNQRPVRILLPRTKYGDREPAVHQRNNHPGALLVSLGTHRQRHRQATHTCKQDK